MDEIIKDLEFGNVNIIKIDTDGHDFEVINGAKKTISSNLPAVLFECDSFQNQNYTQNCIEALNFFKSCGYTKFLVYSNFGYLMGIFELSDLQSIKNLLFYQLTSDFYYFDILVMSDDDIRKFYAIELNFFSLNLPRKTIKKNISAICETA